MDEKNSGGRPSLYKEEYCQLIIDTMSKGDSLTQFAALIGVARETVYDWGRKIPQFSDAIKKAKTMCEAHWERVGTEAMYMGGKDNPFQPSMYIFKMKARFGWKDRQDSEVVQVVPFTFGYPNKKED